MAGESSTGYGEEIAVVEGLKAVQIAGLLHLATDQARGFGVYAKPPTEGATTLVCLTNLGPLDISSPSSIAASEYQAHREWAGPTPGMSRAPAIIAWR